MNEMMFYASRLISDQLNIGEDYNELKQVVSILICDHVLLEEEKYYIRVVRKLQFLNNFLFKSGGKCLVLEKPMKKYAYLFFIFLLISCATFDHKNPYPNLGIKKYGNYTGYEFKNELSDKLIIVLEGSSYYSVLGEKNQTRWKNVGLSAQLLQVLKNEYTFFIPEKLNREIGIDYFDDRNERAKYTFDNLLNNYVYTINSYLLNNNYASIVLIGGSEGALLLPMVYQHLNNKDRVSLLVSLSGGGLSLHEGLEILAGSNITPASWKKLYVKIIDLYKEQPYPDSLEDSFMGMAFRWWSSFIDVRPFDYYVNINIPVLFVHGEKDYRISKESTKYVEKNLPHKPFVYKYYPNMGHAPSGKNEINCLRNDLAELIRMLDS